MSAGSLEINHTQDLETYARAVIPFLEAEPCERQVMRSIIELGRDGVAAWTDSPSFWWLDDDGVTAGAACVTPPWNLLVSSLPPEALSLVAERVFADVCGRGWTLPGVHGPRATATGLAALVSARSGQVADAPRVMLLHELTETREVRHPGGAWRRATAADGDVVAVWLRAFGSELDLPVGGDVAERARAQVAHGMFALWEVEGRPVSMAMTAGPVAGVVRIGAVYTPPELRLRGYARRLVAELSAAALAAGAMRCMLFTEAVNPVSNAIYHQIGYVERGEQVDIRFT